MKVVVTYKNNLVVNYKSFDEIRDNDNVIQIDCSCICWRHRQILPSIHPDPELQQEQPQEEQPQQEQPPQHQTQSTVVECRHIKLTELPDNMTFLNLEVFDCSYNRIEKLPENMNFPKLHTFACSYNKLTVLPENMNFPELQRLDCFNNNLIKLPEIMDYPKLYEFNFFCNYINRFPDIMNCPNLYIIRCSNNNLIELSENLDLPNLHILGCSHNKLTKLPKNINTPNLELLDCFENELTELPDIINLNHLKVLICSKNKLTKLSKNMNLPKLEKLECHTNYLTELPLCILNFQHLKYIFYENNPLELSPQIARFIKRIRTGSITNLNVYNDEQNIHNSSVQKSFKDSINSITTRSDLPRFNSEQLQTTILNNNILSHESKEQLFEYCDDQTVHSLLLLNFSEILWFVLHTIQKDFTIEIQNEITQILNQELKDSLCKCFTGRIIRVVNCLNGFSDLVSINIQDSEQIGNIIFIIKEKLETMGIYTVNYHKELVSKELSERGYTNDVIELWTSYIE